MIDQDTIERVLDTAQVVDVIQDFVSIKKKGSNYIGLCPFHNEKTPSFNVSPSKGIFKCFGCGKGGNSAHFIMEHEHVNFFEAIKYLAKKYHIDIDERELTDEEKELSNQRESMLIVSRYAQKYFTNNLLNNEKGIAIGLSYFRERGFNDTTINTFELGYCPDVGNEFTQTALKNGDKLDYLEKTGLSIVNENRSFDRFRGRVMFPIHSISGRVIGFGGRTLLSDKKIAKYLNSPESEIYYKSKILYGLFQAKNAIVKNDCCYLVEGYTDVISMHQSDIKNIVSSSGTSLTQDQIRLIKRFTNNIVILYDSDPAGIKASQRGIDMILEQGLNVKIVLFPEGEDPDSFAHNHSSSEIINYIENNTQDFIRFKTSLLLEDTKNDPLKKAGLIREIVSSIAVIPDSIKRSVFLQECSKQLDIDEDILYSETAKIRQRKYQENAKAVERKVLQNKHQKQSPPVPAYISDIYNETIEKSIIKMLLLYGEKTIAILSADPNDNKPQNISVAKYIISEIRNDEMKLSNLVYSKIFEEAESLLEKNKPVNSEYFINHYDPELSKVAADVCSPGYELSKIWSKTSKKDKDNEDNPVEETNLNNTIPKLLIIYKRKILESGLKQSQEELIEAEKQNDIELINKLLIKQLDINRIIKQLGKDHHWVLLR